MSMSFHGFSKTSLEWRGQVHLVFITAADIRGNHNDNQIFVHGETKDTTGSIPSKT